MPDPRLQARIDEIRDRLDLDDRATDAIRDLLDEVLGVQTFSLATPSLPRAPTPLPTAPAALDERYERLAPLGRGGTGEVWRVRDTVLQRTLALKLLRDAGRGVDLLGEARAAPRLRHPAIVTVHDVGTTDDGPHLHDGGGRGSGAFRRSPAGPGCGGSSRRSPPWPRASPTPTRAASSTGT
ncbi:MAG: hypothetical protein R3F59_19665 [Myxococcota bacterium]